MLDLRVEWHDAPGVKDRILAKTWARLEITAGRPTSARSLTSCVRARSNSVQEGVYGSVFPLAEWIVENWWFLLGEPLRVPEYGGGRDLSTDAHHKPWVQRHDLIAAREGGALPDLSFYRDGPDVVMCWFPDPEFDDRIRPTRFINPAGFERIAPAEVEDALGRFVGAVLERLDRESEEDTKRLRSNWGAVVESRRSESDLCLWSAALGLDPYDARELTDELVELLEGEVSGQPTALRNDLLEASSARTLAEDLEWTEKASARLGPVTDAAGADDRSIWTDRRRLTAAEMGYQRAAEFRKAFDIPEGPLEDLPGLLHQRCGWPEDPELIVGAIPGAARLTMVGKDAKGLPRIVGGPVRREASRRFRLARALYFLPSSDAPATLRLATGAFTWDQRASRAFAAELLAPASAIRSTVGEYVSTDTIDDLADAFKVSSWVIEHQIDNHRIGWIDQDG